MADKRLEPLHTLSSKLVREKQTVVPEDLNVSGMVKNHKLARAGADAGWRLFRTLLEFKAWLYDRQARIHQPLAATSQPAAPVATRAGRRPCPSVPGGVQPVERRVSPACWCLAVKQEAT